MLRSWTVNTAIASIFVPAATGSPTPTYAVVGSLPSGISFNTTTRIISGTPTATGSGTIRIRATNSQGSDDWTVSYTAAAVPMTVPDRPTGLAAAAAQGSVPLTWDDPSDSSITSYQILRRDTTGGETSVTIHIDSAPVGTSYIDTTDVADSNVYRYRIKARNGQGLSLQSNFVDVTTLAASASVPAFTDNTGDAQTWTQNAAITSLTVPAATGTPTPTYAAVGALPSGISFNANTRVLSGTPTALGSGTIRIRASNSAGSDDWTVSYTTSATNVAPSFADNTGNAQTWTQNEAITLLTVPAATGSPTPTYAAVGSLPAGVTFNTTTRAISGTPTALGSGTITIRATNSEGSDDWTVTYATTAATTGDSVTVPLTGISVFTNYIRWSDNQSLGSAFDANGQEQVLTTLDLNNASPSGQVFISIVGTNNRFTPAFEASGRIIFEASDGELLEVTIGDADISEPYMWVPSNSLEVVAFVLHIKTLTDQDATLTLQD